MQSVIRHLPPVPTAGAVASAWPGSVLALADPRMLERRALPQALELAQATGARLHLRMIVDELELPPEAPARMPGIAREAYLHERREWLESYRRRVLLDPARVDVEILWSRHYLRSFRLLMDHTRPDLVFKDSSCHDAVVPDFLTPLDWRLERACDCPLQLSAAHGPAIPQRVAAAVDCTRHADQALNHHLMTIAAAVAQASRAELHLVSVRRGHAAAMSTIDQPEPRPIPPLMPDFEMLRAWSGVPRERCHSLQGKTVRSLNAFAEARCIDLLVAGAVPRRGLERLVFGSTGEELMLGLRCDALMVKQGLQVSMSPHS